MLAIRIFVVWPFFIPLQRIIGCSSFFSCLFVPSSFFLPIDYNNNNTFCGCIENWAHTKHSHTYNMFHVPCPIPSYWFCSAICTQNIDTNEMNFFPMQSLYNLNKSAVCVCALLEFKCMEWCFKCLVYDFFVCVFFFSF